MFVSSFLSLQHQGLMVGYAEYTELGQLGLLKTQFTRDMNSVREVVTCG